MRTVRVGGFFSGIGSHISACKRLSDRADFVYVFQCEWDQRTAEASDDLHGKIPNLGDITQVHDIGGDLAVDLLYWTPPCQDISNAGKMAGNSKGSGTRSSLAFEVPRILSATPERERPRYLVMEEVPMMVSKKFKTNFDELLGELSALGYQHEWGKLYASECGIPQSRQRVYVISKLGAPAPKLPKPIPLTKCMGDFMEPEPVAPEYYLSAKRLEGLVLSNEKEEANGNNYRFCPTDGGGDCQDDYLPGRRAEDGQLCDKMMDKLILAAMLDIDDHDINRRVYSPSGICPTIRAASGGNTEPKVLVSSMPKVMMAGHIEGRSTYARRDWVLSPKGTAPTVLANWGAKSPPPLVAVGKDEPRIIVRGRLHEGGCNMTLRVYDPVGLCPTQWASQGRDPIKVVVPKETYIEIPTWPEYNNQNRVYLRGGICPTLTTQYSHSKPPLVLVEGTK